MQKLKNMQFSNAFRSCCSEDFKCHPFLAETKQWEVISRHPQKHIRLPSKRLGKLLKLRNSQTVSSEQIYSKDNNTDTALILNNLSYSITAIEYSHLHARKRPSQASNFPFQFT